MTHEETLETKRTELKALNRAIAKVYFLNLQRDPVFMPILLDLLEQEWETRRLIHELEGERNGICSFKG